MPAPDSIHGLVPFVHTEDIDASVDFYGKLGFAVTEKFEPGGILVWCMLRSGEARLMLASADVPIDHTTQGVLFYLYTEDLDGYKNALDEQGIRASEIGQGPTGLRQLRIEDPDGYCLMIAGVAAAEFAVRPD